MISFNLPTEHYFCISTGTPENCDEESVYGSPETSYEFEDEEITLNRYEFKRIIKLGNEASKLGQFYDRERLKERKVTFSETSELCYWNRRTRIVKLGKEGKKRYKTEAKFIIWFGSGEYMQHCP
jgi:hypothetical protein